MLFTPRHLESSAPQQPPPVLSTKIETIVFEDLEGGSETPAVDRSLWCSHLIQYVKALDLRFPDPEEEHDFKLRLEHDLLRWMLLGCSLAAVCTAFNLIATFGPELMVVAHKHDFGDFSDVRNKVFFGQMVLWTIVPAVLGCLIALRLFRQWFVKWNWEVIVTATMCYGAVVIVLGQLYHLTMIFGGAASIWESDVTCSAEAWVLLGLNCMTTAACFFLPLRSRVSWLVAVFGVISYSVIKGIVEVNQPSQLVVKILLILALSYLAWHGSSRNERHLRTEWRAVREVQKASETIAEQRGSIQQKGREIQEKEKQIQATTDLVRSLQTVTRALCDTMVHLTADLRVRDSDMASTFFERQVEGMLFTDLLSPGDQARFSSSLSRASSSHIPVCLPVTVNKMYTTSECHLVLVHRGNTEFCYLVGIRVERELPTAQNVTQIADLSPTPAIPAMPSSSFTVGNSSTLGSLPSLPGMAGPDSFQSVLPRGAQGFRSIDEDLESDFSFTTYPKTDPPRPPKFTNFRSRARTIRMILKRWNVSRDCESCCQYHTVLDTIDEAVECLRQQKCDPLWSTYPEQCLRCACMNQGPKCVVCGFAPEAGQKGGRPVGRPG